MRCAVLRKASKPGVSPVVAHVDKFNVSIFGDFQLELVFSQIMLDVCNQQLSKAVQVFHESDSLLPCAMSSASVQMC
jgi:hypothetical protein